MKKTYSLAKLAAVTNVPERTIRYYISRGLLPPPIVRGRKASYSEQHVEFISRIKKLQSQGFTLSEIANRLANTEEIRMIEKPSNYLAKSGVVKSNNFLKSPIEEFSTWYVYKIGDDINVHIKSGVSPWRIKKIINTLKTITEEQI
ncbi:MAG: helix-turn-helix domain-containing protein [Verrucomicrobiia bacterium]